MILLKLTQARYRNVKDLNLTKNVKNCHENWVQLFFPCLPALFLAGQLRFCLIINCSDLIDLAISLKINKMLIVNNNS